MKQCILSRLTEKYARIVTFVFTIFAVPHISDAQVNVTGGYTATQLATYLSGPGVSVSGASLTCPSNAYGEFMVVSSTLGLDSGIVLTNGTAVTTGTTIGVNVLTGTASSNFASTGNGTPGDPLLDILAGGTTYDACILEFDFIPTGDSVKFKYVFGSEEYTDFTCSSFNDVFGFFISGGAYGTPTNIALVPGTSIPVCINSVNCGPTGGGLLATCTALGAGSPFCAYYVNNLTSTTLTYDGITTVMTALAVVVPSTSYHLKMGVADATDDVLDSGVFIEGGSLISTTTSGFCNSPCIGDTLFLTCPGDSTGATYLWYGFGSSTTTLSTSQSFFITPTTWADTGLVHVVKVHGTHHDTAIIHVTIHPNPVYTASSTSPMCAGLTDTLHLYVAPISAGDVFHWTGPNSFVSNVDSPTVNGFTLLDAGVYTVVGTTIYGCKDTATTTVVLVPPPVAPIFHDTIYCLNATFVPFTGIYTGTLHWYPTDTSTTGGTTTAPTVNTSVPGVYYFYVNQTACGLTSPMDSFSVTVQVPPIAPHFDDTTVCFAATSVTYHGTYTGTLYWYPNDVVTGTGTAVLPTVNTWVSGDTTLFVNQVVGGCQSPMDSFVVTVLPQIVPLVNYSIHRGCNGDTVLFANNSLNAYSYNWNFGDAGTSSSTSPEHVYTTSYNYSSSFVGSVTLTAHSLLCLVDTTFNIDTRHPIHGAYTIDHDTICINSSITFSDASTIYSPLTYLWYFGDGSPTATGIGPNSHQYTKGGAFTTELVVTDTLGCQDSEKINIFVITLDITSFHDTTLCLGEPLKLYNHEITNLGGQQNFNYSWSPATGLDNPNIHVPAFSAFGDFTYTLTATVYPPLNCAATDVITIHSILGAVLTNVTPNQTVMFGSSLQLNSGNELYYSWTPDDGSLSNPNINNPVVTPSVTTTYTVYGYDKYGCLDSAFVTITVDSTLTETVPTAFSPNGDGLNDVFRPVGITFQNLVEFRVFNRWGQELFFTNNKEKGWDGTFNGVPQDIGTYFYVAAVSRPNHQENVVYKGEFTLIR